MSLQQPTTGSTPVFEIESVTKRFALSDSLLDRAIGTREFVTAVDDVSLTIHEGETLGLVGESGSGKSTLANLITGLYEPTEGTISFDGEPLGHVSARPTDVRSEIGMVFQNPKASIDPRMAIRDAIEEPMKAQGWSRTRREERMEELLSLVNLSEHHADRYAHELSGGQAQRVAIARAVALEPRVLVLDEPTSALDVSVQAKITNLLVELQETLGLTMLFIAHDLSVVEHIADRVAVMYLGQVMEVAPTEQLFERPTHPYTSALLSAIPEVGPDDGETVILDGDIPSPVNPPSGCVFHTRCPIARPECAEINPQYEGISHGRTKCLYPIDDEIESEAEQ
ncbi:ABC transporter ATP-binding protein [Haladaptatus sp. DFWS20]|uniref:ABC transporter ATP-binding protein n=1 Tax=Haladaptatus sp. DFWS20 TaxID=3403467 RepID=UPI003EBC0C62